MKYHSTLLQALRAAHEAQTSIEALNQWQSICGQAAAGFANELAQFAVDGHQQPALRDTALWLLHQAGLPADSQIAIELMRHCPDRYHGILTCGMVAASNFHAQNPLFGMGKVIESIKAGHPGLIELLPFCLHVGLWDPHVEFDDGSKKSKGTFVKYPWPNPDEKTVIERFGHCRLKCKERHDLAALTLALLLLGSTPKIQGCLQELIKETGGVEGLAGKIKDFVQTQLEDPALHLIPERVVARLAVTWPVESSLQKTDVYRLVTLVRGYLKNEV